MDYTNSRSFGLQPLRLAISSICFILRPDEALPTWLATVPEAIPEHIARITFMTVLSPECAFIPCQIAILTVSDSRTIETDRSGALLAGRVATAGHFLKARSLVPDNIEAILSCLTPWTMADDIDVIITTGGTGVTGRDVTPEAFERLLDKKIPGFGELFRMLSYAKIGTSTIQSRAMAGIANGTFLFALPGSTGAVKDGWDDILVHQLDSRHRPCNFIELMPRLREI